MELGTKKRHKGGDGWSVRLESVSDRGIKGCWKAPLLVVSHDLHLGDAECVVNFPNVIRLAEGITGYQKEG